MCDIFLIVQFVDSDKKQISTSLNLYKMLNLIMHGVRFFSKFGRTMYVLKTH